MIKKYGQEETQAGLYIKYENDLIDNILFLGNFIFTSLLWKGSAPPKVEVFIWILLQSRVYTRAFLAHRHLLHPSQAIYPFSEHEKENVLIFSFIATTCGDYGNDF